MWLLKHVKSLTWLMFVACIISLRNSSALDGKTDSKQVNKYRREVIANREECQRGNNAGGALRGAGRWTQGARTCWSPVAGGERQEALITMRIRRVPHWGGAGACVLKKGAAVQKSRGLYRLPLYSHPTEP